MASTPQAGSKSPTMRRILREAAEMSTSPSHDYAAEPLESDLFEWHFTLKGPPNSVYSNGIYHGRIVLPPTYPLRPPSFRFTTPSGRFEANREICLSISGHHEETWQPAWGIRTALVALRSFMETDARGQLGGLETTDAVRQRLANDSAAFRCPTCAKSNADIMRECEERAVSSTTPPENEIIVPKNLRMGWRDDMKDNTAQDKPSPGWDKSLHESIGDDSGSRTGPSETDELAEGFVDTIPQTAVSTPSGLPTSASSSTSYAQSRPPQVAMNTEPAPPSTHLPTAVPRSQSAHDGVPLWIDRAIVVLVVALIALLLKVLCGL